MSEDLKTSLLVNRQLPEYVKDEYPTFVAFVESYYKFLEQDSNSAISAAKSLRNVRDVDASIDSFETNFYNTYGSLIPLEVQSNKALLFKHLTQLYRTKGSDSSIKLLFRLVFGEDIDVVLPQNNVLKASSSKWQIDNKLRINPNISSVYDGDGATVVFTLAQVSGADDIDVYVDGVLQSGTYRIRKEYRQIVFDTAPPLGSIVHVDYNSFNITLLNNRKVIGLTSGATAIIEDANRRIISDTFNLGLPIELLINTKSLNGDFLNGEIVSIPIIDSNDVQIDIRASTFSIVRKFNVVDGGYNYQVGDAVTVAGGNATVNAIGTVSSVFSGAIDSILVSRSGAAFTSLSPVVPSGNGTTTFTIVVDEIDTSGVNAANSLIISNDIIANTLDVNILINSADYSIHGNSGNNSTTRIANAISYTVLSVGPIVNVKVLSTSGAANTTPLFDAAGATFDASRSAKSLRSIGKFKINLSGGSYAVGDEIVFGSNPPGTYGIGAAAIVSSVDGLGGIVTISTANSRLTGTATITSACNEVNGTSTKFLSELFVGDKVTINGESKVVFSVVTDTQFTTTDTFTNAASNKKVGIFGRYPIGGQNYVQNNFPTVTVSSGTGSGADIEIDSLVSDGESLLPSGIGLPGEILEIQVTNPGSGYEYIPIVSIAGGSGTATANADIERSYVTSPGRWISSDSLISSFERKIAGQEYYVSYSYVVASQIDFYRYKQMLKDLLHPVGFVNYAQFNKEARVELDDVYISDIASDEETGSNRLTISGRVNVSNGSPLIVGTSTKFNVAVTKSILTAGSFVAVNGEIRRVNSINSNTSLLTSSNVSEILIANSGSGYSNGMLIFSGGGGRITGLTITSGGSGYTDGTFSFTGPDEAIPAIASYTTDINGTINSVTLTGGGIYANTPVAVPSSDSNKVLYANTITVTNRGAGYKSGYFIFSGGSPTRAADITFDVYPSNGAIRSITVNDPGLYKTNPTITPNSSPNVVVSSITVTAAGSGHSNGVLTFSGGDPSRAASASVEVYPANGAIRRVTILDSGLYTSAPTAVLNTTPINVSSIAANSANYNGRCLTAGYLVFSGGNPVRDANVSYTVDSTSGNITSFIINDVGLYRSAPTATPNVTPVSVTEVYPVQPGWGYANGNVIFTTSQASANLKANATVTVNSTGSIVSVVMKDGGLYANGADIIVYGILNPANGAVQTSVTNAGLITASFRIGYASNTTNVANLVVSTTTNTMHTAAVSITANSNTVTNATFTVSAVANAQTQAVISIGFTGSNTSANGTYETVNGAITKVNITTPGEYFYQPTVTPNTAGAGAVLRVNSVGSFTQTANLTDMIIWN